MSNGFVPFNKPFLTGKELGYIEECLTVGHLSGDGPFTKRCHAWIESHTGTSKALLTHSCTAALEMSAILSGVSEGDEVIMPSYTFVSTANAFVLRGGVPVFVDIRPDTLNIDETLIEAAITPRTKAIVPVHYAGVACEMDTIMEIARRYKLKVIEDAAQAILADYKGQSLGTFGDFGCISFHETKNILSGEGGALLVNNEAMSHRAEIIREKGTNRSAFFRGQVDKYTWCDVGSSFLPSDINAAFLWAQLETAGDLIRRRRALWDHFDTMLEPYENQGLIRRPFVPNEAVHNAHMYYVLFKTIEQRTTFIDALKEQGVGASSHYVPLHSSPAGLRYGRAHGDLPVTVGVADTLVRLPIWNGLEEVLDHVTSCITSALNLVGRRSS